MRIASVQADKPLAKAGAKKDDLIVTINGVSMRNAADCRLKFRCYWEDKEVMLSLRRVDKLVDITVKLRD